MKLGSNVCNKGRLVCKILFKSDQLCGCYCKMFRGSLFGTLYVHCLKKNRTPVMFSDISNRFRPILIFLVQRILSKSMFNGIKLACEIS